MTSRKIMRVGMCALVALSMLQLRSAIAATPDAIQPTPAPKIVDVALQQDGSLRGQVVDAQGQAVAKSTVALVQHGKLLRAVEADAEGRYGFKGMDGGVYQLITDKGQSVCRVWTANTAPPAAGKQVLVVNDGTVLRGKSGDNTHGIKGWIVNHPGGTVAIAAAAVAIPIILWDADGS